MIRHWHEDPRLVAAAQSPLAGILFAAATAAAFWLPLGSTSLLMGASVLLASFRPDQRRRNLTLAVMAIFVFHFTKGGTLQEWKIVAAGLLWMVAGAVLTVRWPSRAGILVHVFTAAAIATIVLLNLTGWRPIGIATAVVTLIHHTLWRLAYWAKWRQRNPAAPALEWGFTLVPFLGGGGVPIGKGPGYFARHEAGTPAALAASQLAGLKLAALALLWKGCEHFIANVLFGIKTAWFASIAAADPVVPNIMQFLIAPDAWSLGERWAAVWLELARSILELAAFGHIVVGYFRMCGFNIPANTQAPLLASTILDFWNRYYFYFKEVLVDFFFFPAYLSRPGMATLPRTILATFFAAFVGNYYFHAVLYTSTLASGEVAIFQGALVERLVYCGLLTLGLSLSLWRASRNPAPASGLRRLAGMAGAAVFFALIHIWNAGQGEVSLGDRWYAFLSLFRA